ncbi:unnamed protein product [Rhizophagus irregularis]|uniref:PLP-dependent transferase n=1 Tax=Rhizophagus irregularis TaxID=588596 RepID=A0A916E979_9GLOM|nr:unnamed protein product [Rhizophagus irregularis]
MDFRLRNTLLSHTPDIATRARAVPIYATTSFTFKNVEHAANVFGGKEVSSHLYEIIQHHLYLNREWPRLKVELKLFLHHLDRLHNLLPYQRFARWVIIYIISAKCLYGGTYIQLKVTLPRLGINVKFVQGDDPEEFARLIDDKTKAIYLDSMGNPKFNIPDFAICKIAHVAGIPVIIDNTFGAGGLRGYLIKPIEHGADIVIHGRFMINS